MVERCPRPWLAVVVLGALGAGCAPPDEAGAAPPVRVSVDEVSLGVPEPRAEVVGPPHGPARPARIDAPPHIETPVTGDPSVARLSRQLDEALSELERLIELSFAVQRALLRLRFRGSGAEASAPRGQELDHVDLGDDADD